MDIYATGGFTDIRIDRDAIARYGLTIEDVQDVIQSALGGENVTLTIDRSGRTGVPPDARPSCWPVWDAPPITDPATLVLPQRAAAIGKHIALWAV